MKLVILGNGGYIQTLQDVAEQFGYEILAVLDDKDARHPLNFFTQFISDDTVFIPAFGNNEFRLSWIDKLQSSSAKLATLIHPTAYISPKAKIKEGVVILPKAVINTDVVVEKGVILNLGCIVDHGCVIEEGVHLAPGAIVKGENRIPRGMKVDSGEVIAARQYKI